MPKTQSVGSLGFEDSIRLFALSRESAQGINITLQEYRLSRAPAFIALSYEWGPKRGTQEISLNGRPCAVRRNLYDALQAILARRTSLFRRFAKLKKFGGPSHELLAKLDGSKEIFLWVDSLCINQASPLERTHQVGIMDRIYSKAFGVIAWLGSPAHTTHRAIRISREISGPARTASPASAGGGYREPNDAEFEALGRLLNRPYWTRLWILQEVVLASRIVYLCGPHAMVQDQFKWVCKAYQDFRPAETLTGLETLRIVKTWSLSQKDLHVAVAQTSHMACTDPRDAVFALLGITRTALDHKAQWLVPDYSLSAENVFRDLILGLMTERNPLAVKSAADLVGQMVCRSSRKCRHEKKPPLLVPWDAPIVQEVISEVVGAYEAMRSRYPYEAVPAQDVSQYLKEILSDARSSEASGLPLKPNESC